MAEEKGFIKIKEVDFDPIGLTNTLIQQWHSLGSGEGSWSIILMGLFILGFYIWLAMQFLQKILETLASIVENLKKLGLPFLSSREKKLTIRRCQQFCVVLRADLDSIAKAENWNDQWFTDLEAEVEADGGYYNNPLSRLLKRRSYGVRRVPSLIQAIKSSTERCMLLVGEPGSGKSVALRHLARLLADEGVKTRSAQTIIPLYINLRELTSLEPDELNADNIQQFVLEHVRRGDADTAAYVREHWDDYKERGIWLFLFDSFDEIPAVLHAPNGSQAIAKHSQAIRQFMEGMGTCRSVLASREYKGPEALSWHKLRILPLNHKRQDELIENTFLDEANRDLVRQHLATAAGGIFGNPLFLSLLCRYIGDNHQTPTNDHDLLIRHIERLSKRDPDYVQKKYGVESEQLLEGATKLAVIFAEQPDLSLAPTYDEIVASFSSRQWVLPIDMERLLSALIDVKICRSDVKEARPGDRRVAFSHRRYQESLFVQFIALHEDHISTHDLLLDNRWREFTVTLIQSQPAEIVKRFELEAIRLIGNIQLTSISAPKELGDDLYYYDWNNSTILHLLTLLNEGFARRPDLVSNELRQVISLKLKAAWLEGDVYDKLMIVRHGCLLPINEYQEILQWAIGSKIDSFRQASFNNAKYLGPMPNSMSKWIRQRLADETLVANSKIDLHKLNALADLLPKDMGASLIYNRCRSLRNILYNPWPFRYLVNSFSNMRHIIRNILGMLGATSDKTSENAFALSYLYSYAIAVCFAVTYFSYKNNSLPVNLLAAFHVLFIIYLSVRLYNRSDNHIMTPAYLIHRLSGVGSNITLNNVTAVVIVILLLAVVSAGLYYYKSIIDKYIIWLFLIIVCISFWQIVSVILRSRPLKIISI